MKLDDCYIKSWCNEQFCVVPKKFKYNENRLLYSKTNTYKFLWIDSQAREYIKQNVI